MEYALQFPGGRYVEYWLANDPEFRSAHYAAQKIICDRRFDITDWRTIYGVLAHLRAAGVCGRELTDIMDGSIHYHSAPYYSYSEYMALIHVTGMYNMGKAFKRSFREWSLCCRPAQRGVPITDESHYYRSLKQVIYSTVNLFVDKLVTESIRWPHMVAMVAFYRDYDFRQIYEVYTVDSYFIDSVADLDASRRDGLALFAGQSPFCTVYQGAH